MNITAIPQTIHEAVVLPLIATAQTTEERLSQLERAFQTELNETRNLTTELQTTHAALLEELKREEQESKRQDERHEEAMRSLNVRVRATNARICHHKMTLNELVQEGEKEEQKLKPLQAREAFLNSRDGLYARVKLLTGWKI